ncbi:CMT1A duplicated region transcript 1 [Brachionus plicatilis]|uniref:CMT1A duplicated region transcript 1 n=1 Tax=Brachionus plicatilis TaxID=10195 RepID=A0A3M7R436_BRAPC|nr:CMT1A duplicated region transcript 1 [Brachionus plicatilis]
MITESEPKFHGQVDLAPGLKSDMNQSLDSLKAKKVRYRTRNRHGMTKSYNFNINLALDYTCHRFNGDNNFCGKCNSCQIVNQLNNLKQWFDRASHVTIKAFLIGLIVRINNIKIYKYLNDLLKPLTESKDYIYARNKFLPSCDEDHMKATNNRCLDNDYVSKQINATWNWYSGSTNYIKLNFMLSLLNKCDQALVFMTILKLKSILETHNPYSESAQSSYESGSEMVLDAYDDEEDYEEDLEVRGILKKEHEQSISDFKHVDFIRLLPVHLSKSILSTLNKKNLYNCLFVCKYWCNLIKEVHKEGFLNKILVDDMMLLKGTSSKGINPRYANNVDVKVPNLIPGTNEVIRLADQKVFRSSYKSEWNWTNALQGYETRNVIMEERNVFCGPYNVLLLKEKKDPHRVSHFNGKNLVAFGSFDKKIRFIDLKLASEKHTTIQGHAGSIKCMYICEAKKIVVTGSYDTSIRVWSIENGKCLRIFQGHQQTVNCISMDDERDRVISGSGDKTCRVWNLSKKKCWRTFKHMYQINSVAIGEEICISGGSTGKIKVFHLQSGKLIKTISAHMGPVNSIKFDRWHILTCSSDGYALVYSTQGKHKNCMAAMRHPKEVLCMEFQYLRAITGSADGKIRIWSILNGDCLRVMRGNSQCDPILSMNIVENRILLNTEFNMIMMEFEIVQFDYESSMTNLVDGNEEMVAEEFKRSTSTLRKSRNYSQIRASRSELVATPNVKLFNDDRKSVLDHSARPISAKNLREANLVHKITSKPLNITRNSIGNISDFGLKKRESFVQVINYAITSQTTLSGISNRATVMSHSHPNQAIFRDRKIDEARQNFQRELEIFKSRTTDLIETKQYLRDQLKDIKQIEQGSPSNNASPELQREKNLFDTKSCIDARVLDHIDPQLTSTSDNAINRPTSSPSRVDTKTKIRLRQDDLKSIKNFELEKKFDILFNESEPKMNRREKSQKIVSKVFETREQNSATLQMHPINVKSKIPNPRIVSPVKIEYKKQPAKKESVNRSKSAFVQENQKEFVPIFYRPKSNLLNRPPKPLGGIIEVNKFIAGDQLNLMTNKQVDKIMDTFHASKLIPKKSKEAIREDFYKQLWTLKSKGIYHGSLLAKPKSIAPEIRE